MFDSAIWPISGRFVLLRHSYAPSQQGSDHWDLMFEHGDVLKTLRMMQLPPDSPAQLPIEVPAQRIADHRTAYLDYEGAVSGGRGEVKRIASGRYEATITPGPQDSETSQCQQETVAPPLQNQVPSGAKKLEVRLRSDQLSARFFLPVGLGIGAEAPLLIAEWSMRATQ